MTNSTKRSYTLPDLPYDYGALQPHLSAELMKLHHDKHHAAYVKGANETLEKLAGASPADLPGLERAFSFHLGGHQLHSLFWESMSPEGGGRPDGELAEAINDAFGSFDAFETRFTGLMTSIQGVGWAALAWEPMGRRLVTFQLHDHQGTQVMGTVPLLVGDAWEHAYYLDYRNEKEKWAKAFMALADWHGAESRFHAARDASRVLEGVK
jgi:Fe-Mn family superoxide dismutase